jgi:hypothetical protein
MAQDVNLAVRIATVLDAAGLNKADKSVKGFEKSLKSLGKTLGITLSATAVVAFGKKAAQAFIQDQKEAQRLTTAVKNLGLELSAPAITQYIDSLSKASGVTDSQLRPAFQALLTTTGSVTASQKALAQAIDVSAGSGVALETVAQDLANAYVGQTRGLRKYNLGLTQAELKAAKFEDISKKLNAQFSGANAAYLDTYAGKLQMLGTAAGEAQEKIGASVIELAMAVTGASDVEQLISKIASATDFAVARLDNFIEGWKILKAIINSSLGEFKKNIQAVQVEEFNRRMARDYMKAWEGTSLPMSPQALAQQKAAEAAARKRAQALAKVTTKNTAELKKQNALKKAGTVFDLEQIQLIAALRGKLSDEDRKRIEAQLALLNNNDALAQKLTREILMAQDATGGLYRYFLTIGDAKIKNPFAFLDEWIMEFQSKLNNLKFPTGNGATATVVAASTPSVTVTNSGASITSSATMGTPFGQAGSFVDSMGTPFGQAGSYVDSMGTPFGQAGTTVVVNVSGSVISEQDLTETIARNLQNSSLSSGKVAQLERYSGFFL